MCPHTCSKSVDSFKKSNYVYACWGVTGPGPLLGHFSSRMVTFLISWSELIGFCDVWSVHIWFVYALLSMACLSGWVRVKTSLKHSVGKLSHALLMLCFVYVLRNLPYALDAAFWIFSRELFACSWCYALNILYCMRYALDAMRSIFYTELAIRCHCYALNIIHGTCETLLVLRFETFSTELVTRSWCYAFWTTIRRNSPYTLNVCQCYALNIL